MKIGILVPSIGAFGQKGYYNMQETGHAKALSKYCSSVSVYKLVNRQQEYTEEAIPGSENGKIYLLPSRRLGSNGFPDMTKIDPELDALVLCADIQLAVPRIARWARKNDVKLIPYIGVTESHSTNKLKKILMNLLFKRNLTVYKKHHCAVKTPTVKEELERLGVPNVTIAPVGLDLNLMKSDYLDENVLVLKSKYGYAEKDKVLLFVGRMTEEKQPLRMIGLFDKLYCRDNDYKLLMVGTGELQEEVVTEIKKRNLTEAFQVIERIPNQDIWELYRIADCFVNLSQHEIFGMAILEAMYYGCKVVAWNAPGPSCIIEDEISGCLADNDAGILKAITEKSIAPEVAHQRILSSFTWDGTAKIILAIAQNP